MRDTYEAVKEDSGSFEVKYHPIALRLEGQAVSVVGGGPVAERKILRLITAGADVKVISPRLTSGLARLIRKGALSWCKRSVVRGDIDSARIIIAATSDKRVNKDISRWAQESGGWVNVVDDSALSNFISPAILRHRKSIIAVYTDGKDPELSRDLKNFLEERWDEFLSYRDRS